MVLEEYSPELIYIKGPDNVVADALSRLDLLPKPETTEIYHLDELLSFEPEEIPAECYPLKWAIIRKEQQKDRRLLTALQKYKGYNLKTVHGGGKQYPIIHYRDRVVIPQSLQSRVVNWYHESLMHPGINRTEMTIRQHFTWPNLTNDVKRIVGRCPTCQLTKKNKKKVGHLPPKEA